MEVQVISQWQRRLKFLLSLWFLNLPHDAGCVVALIGNRIPVARVYLLQNVIAVWWGLFSLWHSKLLWPLAFFTPLLCSVYQNGSSVLLPWKVNSVHPGLQQNAVHIHGAGPTPWCQSQCNNLWGKSKVRSLNASRVGFSLKHLLCTFIRLVGGKMKLRGVMVSGLGANSGMGGLCLTPCLVHTLQIPSKGFKTRSFIFLCMCALFMWFKSKALQARVVVLVGMLSWYCRVAMLYWQCCVVLAKVWLVLLQWPSATSQCVWIKQPSQSKAVVGLYPPSVTGESPGLFLISGKVFLSQLPLLSHKAVFSRSVSLGSRKTPSKLGNGLRPLHCGPFLPSPHCW